MLEARGIETHLLSIEGRGPVVFGKLQAENARRTVIFYAHYDGQPVDPAAWTDQSPFEPVLRDNSIEAGGKPIPFLTPAARVSYLTRTTGASTPALLPMTSLPSSRFSPRSTLSAPKKFPSPST